MIRAARGKSTSRLFYFDIMKGCLGFENSNRLWSSVHHEQGNCPEIQEVPQVREVAYE